MEPAPELIFIRNSAFSSARNAHVPAVHCAFCAPAARVFGQILPSLQSKAYGGLTAFNKAYKNAGEYSQNKFEIAAYSFGGRPGDVEDYLPKAYKGGNAILNRKSNWWRK